jgi:hypothetical protein
MRTHNVPPTAACSYGSNVPGVLPNGGKGVFLTTRDMLHFKYDQLTFGLRILAAKYGADDVGGPTKRNASTLMHPYDPISMSIDPRQDEYEMTTVEIVVEDEKEAIAAVPVPTGEPTAITSVVVRPHARCTTLNVSFALCC